VPESQLQPVSGGERVRLSDDIVVSVYPSLHSCVWTGPFQQPDVECLGDVGLTIDQQKLRFRELEAHIATLSPEARAHALRGRQGDRGDGGALIYLIETPEGSLLYQDTSGHWSGLMRDLRPDVAILAAAGRGNIDGDPIQGTLAEFVARQAAFLQPKRVLLSHHDNWLPGFSLETNTAPIRDALAERVPTADLVETGYMASYPLFR
jgi:L-ascorbate metabolism protein UlaG (beta-lactamase superfamily)